MNATALLAHLNTTYRTLHTSYEKIFRLSYMGDHSEDKQMSVAQKAIDDFRTDEVLIAKLDATILSNQKGDIVGTRLLGRKSYFDLHHTPTNMKSLKNEIDAYETALQSRRGASQQNDTGYIDPISNEFVQATTGKMRLMISTDDDENMRRACWEGCEKSAATWTTDLIRLVKKRNEYARGCGYSDFYEFKAKTEERMGSTEIFNLFDSLYTPLARNFQKVRNLEIEKPGLREPWNLGYMLAGDFTKQKDPHFPLSEMIDRRGKSMTGIGVDYQGATLRLDLLERAGKYNNGFCHQPVLGRYTEDGIYMGGETNFTCNAIPKQIGSGDVAGATLFHEGGHAAHFANMKQTDVIFNTEYAPGSVARAETQSMFLDTMYSSIEWNMIYAKTVEGVSYPRDLYEKIVHELAPLAGRGMLGMSSMVKFEQTLYTVSEEELTVEYVTQLASDISTKYSDYTRPSLRLLDIPHIYSRSSSAYYHGYGMATLALYQMRAYIYERDGYIVDNTAIGPWMQTAREYGSSKSMPEMLEGLIGTGLDAQAYLDVVTLSSEAKVKQAHERVAKTMEKRKEISSVDINATIELRDGKELIGSSEADGRDGMLGRWRKRVG